MTGAAPAIEIDALSVRVGSGAGERTLVDAVSLRAGAGAVTALLGPNGAGKTTTVETVEGYRAPSAGRVRVCGLDPRAEASSLAPRLGVMLQRGGVYLTMGPAEVLSLFASYYGARARRPAELLERLGLVGVARTPWRRLSGGEQQRLGLALALVGSPDVVILDEPTAAVDAAARGVIRALISELRHDGVCVLVTTHDIDEAERLADRVVILDHGRVVADGTPAELMRAGADDGVRFGIAAPGPPLMADALAQLSGRLGGAAVTATAPGEYLADVASTPVNVAVITAWLAEHDLALADLRAGRQRLEDVFVRLTAETSDAGPSSPRDRGDRGARGARGRR